jgi:hypothetical protein
MTHNTAALNALATAFGNLYNSGTLEIRTAANAVLATITLPATAFGSPTAGAIAKNGTWSAEASASGVAAKAVFIGGSNQSEVTVGASGSGAEMIINNVNIVDGGTVTVTAYTYTRTN